MAERRGQPPRVLGQLCERLEPSSIRHLRDATQQVVEPPVYKPARIVSVYVTRLLLRTPVTADVVSLLHMTSLAAAGIAFAKGTRLGSRTGSCLLLASYVLDCCDGEIARARGQESKVGAQLEQVVHWTGGALSLAGAVRGLAQAQEGPSGRDIGMLALVGGSSYHFVYYQLNLYATPGRDYGPVHAVTRWLYRLMPIDTNLLILGGLIGRVRGAVLAWAVISNASWTFVYSTYHLLERRASQPPEYSRDNA